MEKNNPDLQAALKEMSSERLQDTLQAEVSKEIPNDDLVLGILNILEDRDKDKPVELTPKEKQAWKEYQRHVRKRSGNLKFHLKRLGAMAATLVIILAVVFATLPQEAKAGSLFDILSRWTDSLVEFFTPGDSSSLVNYTYRTGNAGLQQLRDTVVEYGGTERVIPMWIPEGNELLSLEVDEISHTITVSAVFLNAEGLLVIRADIYDTAEQREFYKNMNDPTEWELFGHTHYVVQNKEQWSAAWAEENTECFITLECSEDVLDKILKSIYVLKEK